MVWNPKYPRKEGPGPPLTQLNRAWSLRKQNIVADSVKNTVQSSNNANGVGPGHNLRVTAGLIGQWWCDAGLGTLLQDSSYLTTETNLTWDTAQGGQWSQDVSLSNRWYLNLSGGGKADNLASNELFDSITGATEKGLTVEAWIKPTTAAGADNPGPGRILSFSNPSDPTHDINFMLGHGSWAGAGYANTNYHGRVRIEGDTEHIWSGDGIATTNLQHVVMTCKFLAADTNNSDRVELKMYVDNVLKATTTTDVSSPDIFADWASSAKVVLGAEHDNTRKANGGYYLVAVYDRALTAGEVGENYTEGVVSVSNAYLTGNRAYLYDEPDSIIGGETKTITIGINGSRIGNVTCDLAASAPGMTEGVDFVLDNSTVVVAKNSVSVDVSLSCSPALSADVNIGVAITGATGSNTISPPGANVDLVTIPAISKTIKPELKIAMDNDPQHMVGGVGFGNMQAWRVTKSRPYHENVEFYFSATEDVANLASYYFVSGGSTGGFSAPYMPTSATTGPNNTVWQAINGAPVVLSSYVGGSVITVDGTVLENMIINTNLNIKANNVTIRNCLITPGNSSYGINNVTWGATGTLIEDCYVGGTRTGDFTSNPLSASILGRNIVIRRCECAETGGDGVKLIENSVLESCYIHDLADTISGDPGAHSDAVQIQGGNNIVIRWNNFYMPIHEGPWGPNGPYGSPHSHTPPAAHQSNVCTITQAQFSDIYDLIFDSNWFVGGGYCIFTGNHGYGNAMYDIYYIYNKFSRDTVNENGGGEEIVRAGYLNSSYDPGSWDIRYGNTFFRLDGTPDGTPATTDVAATNPMDNVIEPPVIPGYDVGVEERVDLSTGIKIEFDPYEETRRVLLTCSAGDTGGVFAADDSITGYLISGSVGTGVDAGDSLTVCSTLSSNEIIFTVPPLPGLGGNDPFTSDTVLTTPVNNPDIIQVGETSATTGPRVAVTDWVGAMPRYVDLGTASKSYDIEVPPGGLMVSGHKFTSIKLRTNNPLTFVDCQFSGQTDYHANVTPPAASYVVWDGNYTGDTLNDKVDFEYCDFRGGSSATLLSRFRRLYKCRLNHNKSKVVSLRSSVAYRIDNCWFGPDVNIEDSALNGNNGTYSPSQGFNPHGELLQIIRNSVDTVVINHTTFDTRSAYWSDSTVNPDHHRGATPSAVFQIAGNSTTPANWKSIHFNNCIFHGAGHYLFYNKSQTLVPNVDRNMYFIGCKFGTGTKSGFISHGTGSPMTVNAKNNTWLETGTKAVKLPPEAIAAGTVTNNGLNVVTINDLLEGVDSIPFHRDGLNESGLSAWSKRSTPI